MGRRRKEFRRPEAKLDCRLIVIASEGRNPEENYFRSLAKEYENKRVHVEIVESVGTKNDPESVLARLDAFRGEYDMGDGDNLYLVIDRDRWTLKNLSHVAREAKQKGFFLALSNPNFELWILLHVEDVSRFPDEKKKSIFENKKVNKHKRCLEEILGGLFDGYNKPKFDCARIVGEVEDAIENARRIDIAPKKRWPNYLATRVYILAEDIIKDA